MYKILFIIFFIFLAIGCNNNKNSNIEKLTDTNTPLHALQPDYDVNYDVLKTEEVEVILDKVYNYLIGVTPAEVINKSTGNKISDFSEPVAKATLSQGDFRLTSYEWGVTYSGMINLYQITGKEKYSKYVKNRLSFLANIKPYFEKFEEKYPEIKNPLHQIISPGALDDAGAMCAAYIKAESKGIINGTKPLINNYIDWISNRQYRLDDGTLARNRPHNNTLWLDDLFMSVPALAQMSAYTGEKKYLDDAVKQILLFSKRMFNRDKGLYFHGWVKDMKTHPEFYWARANGWALMATVELLTVMPEDHPDRDYILKLLNAHINGLVSFQSGKGLWHQLIDKNDSFLETSSTAIYAYSIAKSINEKWIDAQAYGPSVLLAWAGVSSKINDNGQVEGTCVGTGMAFDPAFYYYRPVNVYAAHGYGPVLLAGSEIIRLINNYNIKINDSAIQVYY